MAKKAVKKVAKKAVKKVAKKAVKKVAKKAVKKVAKKALKKVAKKPVKKEIQSEKYQFAIFSQDPPGYTNAGVFSFFDEISDLENILLNMYACYQSLEGENKERLIKNILNLSSKLKKQDLTNELIQRVEEVIENSCDILYLGKTSDLAYSTDDFSKMVRSRFRGSDLDENSNSDKPVEASELKEFFSYVSEYFHG
jgi:hypothetical protein